MKSLAVCLLLSLLPPAKERMTIWMTGDSTMSVKKPEFYPETGWGMALGAFFRDDVRIANRAMNGRSTLSFIREGRWQAVVEGLREGDYVLMQFGHNDEKTDKPGTGTSHEVFKANLARFVRETRAKKAVPVLLTSIARRHFEHGVLLDTHKGYPNAMRELADSLEVPLIDLERETSRLLRELGEEGSIRLFLHVPAGHMNYPSGKQDNTHLSPDGAKAVAALAVEGMKACGLDLVKYLR